MYNIMSTSTTVSKILSKARSIVLKHEILSSEVRVLILTIIDFKGEISWNELKRSLEKTLGYTVNPNMLAFHLRRIINAKLVERIKVGREVKYRSRIEDEIRKEIEPLKTLLKEVI